MYRWAVPRKYRGITCIAVPKVPRLPRYHYCAMLVPQWYRGTFSTAHPCWTLYAQWHELWQLKTPAYQVLHALTASVAMATLIDVTTSFYLRLII